MKPKDSSEIKRRTRTGCLACRKRRVKCDEEQPRCQKCTKSNKDCTYPPHSRKQLNTTIDITIPNPASNLLEPDTRYSSDRQIIFNPNSSPQSQCLKSRNIQIFHFDPIFSISSSMAYSDVSRILRTPSPRNYSAFPTTIFDCDLEDIQEECLPRSAGHQSTNQANTQSISQSLSIHPNQSWIVKFFLIFHYECVSEYHYFLYIDTGKLCTKELFAMATKSDSIRYAMVAFSALIYSIKNKPSSLHLTFLYYNKALQEFRSLLSKNTKLMDIGEHESAIATALLLSAVDRFLGAITESFQHLKGACTIFMTTSNPMWMNSSGIGRSLLNWYTNYEDHFSLIEGYPSMLPIEWRKQSIQIQQLQTDIANQQTSKEDRLRQLLDDAHARLHMFAPQCKDVLHQMSELRNLNEKELSVALVSIEINLHKFHKNIQTFIKSSQVREIIQCVPPNITVRDHHISPPQLSFPGYRFLFPEVGFLLIEYFAYQCLMHLYLYTTLFSVEDATVAVSKHSRAATYYAVEICKTLSGLDDSMGYNPDRMLPCSTALYLAALCIPNWERCQSWIRFKLDHLEYAGYKLEKKHQEMFGTKWRVPEYLYG